MTRVGSVLEVERVAVNVVARDHMLAAGATSALHGCPDVVVLPADEQARVTVVMVDEVDRQTLDLVRARHNPPHRAEVVLVATDLAPGQALHAILAGARGLLRRREASPERLARVVLAAATGDSTVPPDLLDRVHRHGTDGGSAPTDFDGTGLSDRERAVLSLVAEGHETGEIAKKLSYSPRTVTTVVHDITYRFRLRNRAHAVAYALRAGLL